MNTYDIELGGCTAVPLMSYLKSLGVFRVISEQKDNECRVWWQDGKMHLRSLLDYEALVEFFIKEYSPSPVVSPWNSRYRSGATDEGKLGWNELDMILSSEEERFADYRATVLASKRIMEQETDKETIMAKCRATFPDNALDWLDAAYVLTGGKSSFPPLASNGGTVGTSGSGDLSINYVLNLIRAFGMGKRRRNESDQTEMLVKASLFGDVDEDVNLYSGSSTQFQPGGWGPNSTAGFDGDSMVNPWDFVLMMEGLLVFTCALSRKLSASSRGKAAFPFTVNPSAAGYGSSVSREYVAGAKAEFWAPIWDRPTSLREISKVISEGRAQLGRRQAANGVEFARAIAGLGIERGITSFNRFGFLSRTGQRDKGVLTVPIGKFAVKSEPKSDVLYELDSWMDSIRRAAYKQKDPTGIGIAMRRIDNAVMSFCQRGRPEDLQNVLIAMGHAERWLSTSSVRGDVRPLGRLSRYGWINNANNDTAEFRLACALSSIVSPEKGDRKVGPVRENMEPIELDKGQVKWSDNPSFIWTNADALTNMLAVLERRCIDGRMANLDHPPLESIYSASLSDISDFINGMLDEQRIADLAFPMSFMRYGQNQRHMPHNHHGRNIPVIPIAYAAMKLTLLPDKFCGEPVGLDNRDISLEPNIIAMLQAGNIENAYAKACHRLTASGLVPVSDSPGVAGNSDYARRIAAALLFPVSTAAHGQLAQCATILPDRDRE